MPPYPTAAALAKHDIVCRPIIASLVRRGGDKGSIGPSALHETIDAFLPFLTSAQPAPSNPETLTTILTYPCAPTKPKRLYKKLLLISFLSRELFRRIVGENGGGVMRKCVIAVKLPEAIVGDEKRLLNSLDFGNLMQLLRANDLVAVLDCFEGGGRIAFVTPNARQCNDGDASPSESDFVGWLHYALQNEFVQLAMKARQEARQEVLATRPSSPLSVQPQNPEEDESAIGAQYPRLSELRSDSDMEISEDESEVEMNSMLLDAAGPSRRGPGLGNASSSVLALAKRQAPAEIVVPSDIDILLTRTSFLVDPEELKAHLSPILQQSFPVGRNAILQSILESISNRHRFSVMMAKLQDVADSYSNAAWKGVHLPIDLLSASIETFLRGIEEKNEAARKKARVVTPTDELEGALSSQSAAMDSTPQPSKQLFARSESRTSNPAPAALETNAISLPQPASPMAAASPLRGDAAVDAVDAAPEVDSETERNLEQVLESRRDLFGELYSEPTTAVQQSSAVEHSDDEIRSLMERLQSPKKGDIDILSVEVGADLQASRAAAQHDMQPFDESSATPDVLFCLDEMLARNQELRRAFIELATSDADSESGFRRHLVSDVQSTTPLVADIQRDPNRYQGRGAELAGRFNSERLRTGQAIEAAGIRWNLINMGNEISVLTALLVYLHFGVVGHKASRPYDCNGIDESCARLVRQTTSRWTHYEIFDEKTKATYTDKIKTIDLTSAGVLGSQNDAYAAMLGLRSRYELFVVNFLLVLKHVGVHVAENGTRLMLSSDSLQTSSSIFGLLGRERYLRPEASGAIERSCKPHPQVPLMGVNKSERLFPQEVRHAINVTIARQQSRVHGVTDGRFAVSNFMNEFGPRNVEDPDIQIGSLAHLGAEMGGLEVWGNVGELSNVDQVLFEAQARLLGVERLDRLLRHCYGNSRISVLASQYDFKRPMTAETIAEVRKVAATMEKSVMYVLKRMLKLKTGWESLVGREFTAEHCANISEAKTGREVSDETRAKLSEREVTDEHCVNISAGLTGKALTDEHCANISTALTRSEANRDRHMKVWNGNLENLRYFQSKNGHCLVTRASSDARAAELAKLKGWSQELATWVKNQRLRRKGDGSAGKKLTEEQVALLDKLGFDWEIGAGNG